VFEILLTNIIILFISLVILDQASHVTITNSVKVAEITGYGKTTIGFLLIAFSTSLPELCVSAIAVIGGEERIGIAVGNVLGSNIVNVCLIVGIAVLIIAVKKSKTTNIFPQITREDLGSLYFGLFVASVIPLTLMYIAFMSRFIGVLLILVFILYTYQMSKIRIIKEEASLGEERRKLSYYTFLSLLGIGGVIVSSYFIVECATFIAEVIGIPKVVIGATIIAFGTSLPELATSVESVLQGHPELAFGNIIGSCFVNVTLILGVSLALTSITSVNMNAFSNLVIFSLIANLFLWYFLSSEKISWREGAVLLFLYTLFLVTSFGG